VWRKPSVRDSPPDPGACQGTQEKADDRFSTGVVFIDDFIMVTTHRAGERRATALGMAMLWVCYHFFGYPRPGFPECVRKEKFEVWASELDILGTRWNLNALTITLPQEKVEALRVMLEEEFPGTRTHPTHKELLSIAGRLRSISYCVRPGRFFLRLLTEDVRSYYKGEDDLDDVVRLGPGFQKDLDMWRKVVCRPELMHADLAMPMFAYVRRAPELYVVGDASKHAGGGLLAPYGVWWRMDWPRAVAERFEAMERGEKDRVWRKPSVRWNRSKLKARAAAWVTLPHQSPAGACPAAAAPRAWR